MASSWTLIAPPHEVTNQKECLAFLSSLTSGPISVILGCKTKKTKNRHEVHSELDALTHSAPDLGSMQHLFQRIRQLWRWLEWCRRRSVLNGESQGFLVLENGSEDLFSVSVDPGTYVQLLWTSGDYDDEISFDVLDEAGNVMWTGVFGDEVAQVVGHCAFTADCLYYLETLDSYGDGWNGASLDIYINGWYNGTIDDPDLFDLWYFEAQVGDLIEFEWSSGTMIPKSLLTFSIREKTSFTLAYSETASIR